MNVGAKGQTLKTEKRFSDLKPGQSGCIVGFKNADACAQRLQEMGLCPGTSFRVVKAAPLGDPVEVEFRFCRLCLRKSETEHISVVDTDPESGE